MGEIDKIMKRYFSDNERYADLFNGYLREQVLSGSNLREVDSRTITKIKGGSKSLLVEKFRDIICKASTGTAFVIIGAENQTAVDYAMPIRVMVYDAIVYNEQLHDIAKSNKENKKCKSGPEYLGGFLENDKINAVITLVIYYGQEPWDGSLDLHSIIDLESIPLPLRSMVNNYPIHVLEVNKFKDIDRFQTDIGAVFGFIQHSKDKERLKEFVHAHADEFKEMDDDTYDVIAQLTGQKNPIERKQEYKESEGYNMCKAIDDMIEEGKTEEQGRIAQLIGVMAANDCGSEVVKLSDQNFLEEMLLKYNL